MSPAKFFEPRALVEVGFRSPRRSHQANFAGEVSSPPAIKGDVPPLLETAVIFCLPQAAELDDHRFLRTWRNSTAYLVCLCVALAILAGCSTLAPRDNVARLRQTASLIEEVKAFGESIGIEPTEALRRTAGQGPTLSMLWLWMQREGTLALNAPVDVRLAIGFNYEREAPKIEHLYRVDGYSAYYRQGNEFADARSVATIGFAEEPLVRRVKVILHEDLHGDVNFALPWEVEEAIVTPLGSLAAVEYFRFKDDQKNLANALSSVVHERKLARELMALIDEAQKVFEAERVSDAKEKILNLLPKYPSYQRQFEQQTRNQHAETVIEAKLSHDLAYFRFYDQVAAIAEKAPSLSQLIVDLKQMQPDGTIAATYRFLRDLNVKYSAAGKSRNWP